MFYEMIPQSVIVLSLVGIIVILGRKLPRLRDLKIEPGISEKKTKKKVSLSVQSYFKRAGSLSLAGARVFWKAFVLFFKKVGRLFVLAKKKMRARRKKKAEQKEKLLKELTEPKLKVDLGAQEEEIFKEVELADEPIKKEVIPEIPSGQGEGKKIKVRVPIKSLNFQGLSVEALLTRARDFVKIKSFGQAESACLAAIRKNPKNIKVYKILGNVYFEQGNFKDAQRSFSEVLKRGMDEIDIYKKLGQAYAEQGRKDKVIKIYRRAIKNNRAKEYFYLELGKAYKEQGRRDKLIGVYEDLVREYPGNYKYIELLEKQKKLKNQG